MTFTRFDAISSLVGGQLAVNDDGTKVNYIDKQTPPSDAEIDAELKRLQDEYAAQEYARQREEAYPNFAEQFDKLFHDMTAGKGTKDGEWYKAIAKVKTDNPKE